MMAFQDLSDPGSDPITSWEWDFGDGAVSNEQNPKHTYATEGDYVVRLTITTPAGSDSCETECAVMKLPVSAAATIFILLVLLISGTRSICRVKTVSH